MLWSRLLATTLLIASCGFSPVYGPGGAARSLADQIALDPPTDRAEYIFARHVEERLGTSATPAYRLSTDIAVEEEEFGITGDRDITRIRLSGRLDYVLTEIASGEIVSRGVLTNFTGYSAPVFNADRVTAAGNPITIRSAEADAVERLMVILGDQLVARLLATVSIWRNEA